MPIGIVSDEEFNIEFVNHNSAGRNGAKAVPLSLRQVIAETALTTPNKEVAEAFGVSPASVSAYKNGATSTATYNQPNESLKKHVDTVRDEIGSIAMSKLKRALSHITEENLAGAKPRDLAGIAKDMSTVVNNIQPAGPIGNNGNNVNFIFHSYPTREEKDYDVIDVVDAR